jgi:hypothetical protein
MVEQGIFLLSSATGRRVSLKRKEKTTSAQKKKKKKRGGVCVCEWGLEPSLRLKTSEYLHSRLGGRVGRRTGVT